MEEVERGMSQSKKGPEDCPNLEPMYLVLTSLLTSTAIFFCISPIGDNLVYLLIREESSLNYKSYW